MCVVGKRGTPSVHPIEGDELRALRSLQRERFYEYTPSNQTAESSSLGGRSISTLITEGSHDETQLAKIIAAEGTGIAVFEELIASIKSARHQSSLSEPLAA